MKDTRRPGTEQITGLWNNLTSGILHKVKNYRDNSVNKENEDRDMGDTHTPISRLDLTGLNREQAKVLIGKIIDERLEEISHIEMTDLKIDFKEKERQRKEAAERISERRNRRKQQSGSPKETLVTEQGVYSDYKHASVFDVIQPESFPFEEDNTAPIEGQLSLLDAIAEAKQSEDISKTTATEFAESFDVDHIINESSNSNDQIINESGRTPAPEEISVAETAIDPDLLKPHGFDLFGIFPYEEDEPGEAPVEAPAAEAAAKVRIYTSLDETVDRVFAFFEKNKERLLLLYRKASCKASETLNDRVFPAVLPLMYSVKARLAQGMGRVESRLTLLVQKAETRFQLKNKMAAALVALSAKEEKASEKMMRFVNFLDRVNDAILRDLFVAKDKTCLAVNRTRDYAEHHKKGVLIGFGAGVAAAAVITMVIGSMTAYEYIYNGKVLGVVKNQDDVYKTIDIIGNKLSAQYDADITIDKNKDIRFKKIIAFDQDIDGQEDVLNRLTYMKDMKANGRGIYVDGKLTAILESDKTAREILNEIKGKYVKKDENIKYEKIGFAEDVKIKNVETKLGSIEARDKALEYLLTGAVEKKIHVVQQGETFSEIAKKYGLKQSELAVSNPNVIPEKLQIGDEICLSQVVPLVTVQTTEIAQYKEVIPFSITYENTASMYKKEQTVKSKGANGEKDVVAEIVRKNGVEVTRNELSSAILSQPVSQVVLVGTKEPPSLIGTGSFIYPIRGTLTSRYGTRWGRLHAGIDLAAPIGTHIKAADGGLVTFAGYNGELGYMVAIDHGGGRVTWYGHCSKLIVKKGDRVFQGQYIANVGNTGHSTGPHVHFEVHINGKTKNPLNYL